MSNIDSFKLTPLFGEIGLLKGYLIGLQYRLRDTELGIDNPDISYLQEIVERIGKYLDELVGIDENE